MEAHNIVASEARLTYKLEEDFRSTNPQSMKFETLH